jgi:hypothetical protein
MVLTMVNVILVGGVFVGMGVSMCELSVTTTIVMVNVDNNINVVMMMVSMGVVLIMDGGVWNNEYCGPRGPDRHGPG